MNKHELDAISEVLDTMKKTPKKKRALPARRDPRQLGLALPGLPGMVSMTALTLKGSLGAGCDR